MESAGLLCEGWSIEASYFWSSDLSSSSMSSKALLEGIVTPGSTESLLLCSVPNRSFRNSMILLGSALITMIQSSISAQVRLFDFSVRAMKPMVDCSLMDFSSPSTSLRNFDVVLRVSVAQSISFFGASLPSSLSMACS